jgi:hypothetical protein
MNDDRLQLEYAPPRPGRRWRARRWLTLTGIALLAWALVEWGPTTYDRCRLLWVQRQCADFEFPAGAVVYDSDQQAGKALLADSANYVALDDTSIWPTAAVARREPRCWTSLKLILFPGQSFWPPGPAAPKALVRRLRNRQGSERLVAVIVSPEFPGGPTNAEPSRGVGLIAAIIRPGDWHALPQWDGNGTFFKPGFEKARRLRVFAATADPADPAHFTLDYEMDGQRGTIDGTFQDDGDVTFKIRSGPATPPAPPTPGSAPRISGRRR